MKQAKRMATVLAALGVWALSSCTSDSTGPAASDAELSIEEQIALAEEGKFLGEPKELEEIATGGDDWIITSPSGVPLPKSQYTLDAYRFTKSIVSWKLVDGTPDLSDAEATAVINWAALSWGAYARDLKFVQASPSQTADIVLRFLEGRSSTFPSALGTTRTKFDPSTYLILNDTITFWEDPTGGSVNWSADGKMKLYSVALHEFGHAIGIGHSTNTIMNPTYSSSVQILRTDDINAVHAKYGDSGKLPLMQFFYNYYDAHYYTTSHSVASSANQNGLPFEGVIGAVHKNSGSGLVPLYLNISIRSPASLSYFRLSNSSSSRNAFLGYVSSSYASGHAKMYEKQFVGIDYLYGYTTSSVTYQGYTYTYTGNNISYVYRP